MSQSIAFRDGGIHVRVFLAAFALVLMFLLGSAGGYVARSMTAPVSSGAQQPAVSIPSPTPQQTILPNQA